MSLRLRAGCPEQSNWFCSVRLLSLVDCRTPQAMDTAMVLLSDRIAQAVLPTFGPSDAPVVSLVHHSLAFIASQLSTSS